MGFGSGVEGEAPGGVHAPETRVRVPPPQPSSKQTRRMSLVEAVANVGVGFLVALLTQIIVFPLFSLKVSLGENLANRRREVRPSVPRHGDRAAILRRDRRTLAKLQQNFTGRTALREAEGNTFSSRCASAAV